MDKVYFTPEGYEKSFQELEYLKKVRRPEISRRIEQARGYGDLSENAEYEAAKEAQQQLERKIAEIEDVLSRAEIINTSDISLEKVRVGVRVELEDLNSQKKFSYILVSQQEANIEEDKISIDSPVGKALLGKKKQEVVEIHIPRGILRYKVLDITLP